MDIKDFVAGTFKLVNVLRSTLCLYPCPNLYQRIARNTRGSGLMLLLPDTPLM